MQVPVSNRTLLRSLMAGTLVLLGASACSRSDRTESGSNDNAGTIQDTAVTGATQDVPGTGQDRMAMDTANRTSENTGTGAAPGDTAPASVKSNAPRAATATPSAERKDTSAAAESGAAGYRGMERDTAALHESDSARVTEDTSETSLNQADTASVAGYSEMARDTTGGADQVDTTGNAAVGAEAGDTSMNAGRVRPVEDSTETMGQVTTDGNAAVASDTLAADAAIAARGADTTGNAGRIRPPEDSTEMQGNAAATAANAAAGADTQDTTMNAGRVRPIEDSTETMGQVTTDGNAAVASDTVAGNAAIAARGADTTENAGRIRPPEDSTEMQGNVSSAESASVNAADTADEAPVAESRESDTGDQQTQVASENTDAVGAASMSGTVTGADAVAMMTRAGERCHVVDPEADEEVRWDMSSTPSTLNPCGLGSMNLSKVWTEGR
jgi:trimeric autotransporter adhesin